MHAQKSNVDVDAPNKRVLTFGVVTSVPLLTKIDQEIRLWECTQTDRQTHAHTETNWIYNLSHAICYSYGADNKVALC